MIQADIRSVQMIYGALPGETLQIEKNAPVVRRMAEALMNPEPKPGVPDCPLCGGDAFRFLEGEKVQCLLCSNSGTMTLENETPVFHYPAQRSRSVPGQAGCPETPGLADWDEEALS